MVLRCAQSGDEDISTCRPKAIRTLSSATSREHGDVLRMRSRPIVGHSRSLASPPPAACQQEHRAHQHEDLDCPLDRSCVPTRGGADDERDEESDQQADERHRNKDWAACAQGAPRTAVSARRKRAGRTDDPDEANHQTAVKGRPTAVAAGFCASFVPGGIGGGAERAAA